MAEFNWSDAQRQKADSAVREAFEKANVATAFLPLLEPTVPGTVSVRNERIERVTGQGPVTLRLNGFHDAADLRFVTLSVNVELSGEQLADETLSNALLAFRRAANILALEHDRVVFRGFLRGFRSENSTSITNQVNPQRGLADLPTRFGFPDLGLVQPNANLGQLVVNAVVRAISTLEENSHPAPFACVLGNALYEAVHDPSAALVLASDRITPMLKGGSLLRSGQMDPNTGIVVSLAGNAVDLVIGTRPTVDFLQRQADARYLFRVYMRFALRFRDDSPSPVAGFRMYDPQTIAAEGRLLQRRIS